MKELSVEQKAKRYDEAIKVAKSNYETIVQMNNGCTFAKEGIVNTFHHIFPELKESEDERIRKVLLGHFSRYQKEEVFLNNITIGDIVAWLEKQGEKSTSEEMKEAFRTEYEKGRADIIAEMQKPTQETEPFEAEHGKYYYCIKDYFYGGKKQASKGDVIRALRGLPIMGLKDASEYFLPVNSIKCNPAWSEEDETKIKCIIAFLKSPALCCMESNKGIIDENIKYLKSLKDRVQPQPKPEWNEKDEGMLQTVINRLELSKNRNASEIPYVERCVEWLKSIKERYTWKLSDEQIKVCKKVYADILSAKGFDLGTVNSELNRLETELKKIKE